MRKIMKTFISLLIILIHVLYCMTVYASTEIKLYAKWTPVSDIKITYNPNGGDTPSFIEKTVTYDSAYGALPTVNRENYNFFGWFTDPEGGSAVYNSSIVKVTTDHTLYAHWSIIDAIVVRFDQNGGNTPTYTEKNVVYNAEYGSLPSTTREGYTFTGWYTEADGGRLVNASSMVTNAVEHTLFAQWTPTQINEKYYVIYRPNGSIGTVPVEKKSYMAGDTVSVLGGMKREGYKFIEWNTSKDGSGTSYKPGSVLIIFNNTDLYAIWVKEVVNPDIEQPDVNQPDITQPDISQPDTKQPEIIQPDIMENKRIYEYYKDMVTKDNLLGTHITTYMTIEENWSNLQNMYKPSDNYMDGTIAENYVEYIRVLYEPLSKPVSQPVSQPLSQLISQPEVKDTLADSLRVSLISNHVRYINGYPDGTMRPNNTLTRAEAATMLFGIINAEDKSSALPNYFGDVADDSWHKQPISYLSQINVIDSQEDSYKPDNPITRAEFMVMVAKFYNMDISDTTNVKFHDVPQGHWASSYIEFVHANNLVIGDGSNSIRPDDSITRAEVVTIINKMLNRHTEIENLPSEINLYKDLPASHWAYADILEASIPHSYERVDEKEMWTEY